MIMGRNPPPTTIKLTQPSFAGTGAEVAIGGRMCFETHIIMINDKVTRSGATTYFIDLKFRVSNCLKQLKNA